jgi:hypothetical protein
MLTKRLLFHFYAFDGMENNRAVKIHLKCLEHYRHVFTEATFIIAVNDITNLDIIKRAEKLIIGAGYTKNVTFKVVENTPYREADTLYNEAIMNRNKIDGLMFFGHLKGITNYEKYDDRALDLKKDTDSIDSWIFGLYYFNLEFMDEVVYNMTSSLVSKDAHPAPMYGAFLVTLDGEVTQHCNALYFGSFYWINFQLLRHIAGDEIPPISTKYYSEILPKEVLDWNYGWNLSSHGTKILYFYEPYTETNDIIGFLCENEAELQNFTTLKNNILDSIQ